MRYSERQPIMNAHKIKHFIAAALCAGSLGATSVHAQGLDGAGSERICCDYLDAAGVAPRGNNSSLLEYVDDPRANLAKSHVDDGTNPLKLDLESRHWPNNFELRDPWESYHLPPHG